MTTKERIIAAANRSSYGGYVDTDGAWCQTRNAEEFKAFLEKAFAFSVTACRATVTSTAVATTADGYRISWNGHCSLADRKGL